MQLFSRDRRSIKVAKIISRVFDPIVIIPIMLTVAVFNALVNGERLHFLTFIIMLDVLLPGFVLFWFVQNKRIASGWDVTRRQERIPLFMFVTLAHLIGVIVAWFWENHPMAEYLTSFWLLTVIYLLVTLVWKISIHAGVISALATFLVLVHGPNYAWIYALVLVVIWARVVGQYHRLSQAIGGAIVPMVVFPWFWAWIGLS